MNMLSKFQIKRPSLETFTWFSIAIGFVMGFQILKIGGYEWYWWREATLSPHFMIPKVANPPYIGILIYPLALLPLRIGIFIFSLISIACLYSVHRLTGVNKWLLLISFPALWVLFYSQLDVLTILGTAMGFWAIRQRRSILVGLAITLLAIKPQVGGALALVYLIWARDWRVLIIPISVTLLSFIRYGFWPLDWIHHLVAFRSIRVDSHITPWPWSLMLWLPLILLHSYYSQTQLIGAIAATNYMTAPYTQSYGILTTMAVPYPFWIYPLFSIPRLIGTPPITIVLIIVIYYPLLIRIVTRIWPSASLIWLLQLGTREIANWKPFESFQGLRRMDMD